MRSELTAVPLDPDSEGPNSVGIYLELPRSHLILLTVYFELYDGVGTVRTIDKDMAKVCVITTPSQLDDCFGVLNAISAQEAWTPSSAS